MKFPSRLDRMEMVMCTIRFCRSRSLLCFVFVPQAVSICRRCRNSTSRRRRGIQYCEECATVCVHIGQIQCNCKLVGAEEEVNYCTDSTCTNHDYYRTVSFIFITMHYDRNAPNSHNRLIILCRCYNQDNPF